MQIGKKLKILVVDDNPAVNDVLCQLCSFLGHEVVTAQNGAEGLALVQRDGEIALIFTDFRMPVMNGVEMLRGLKDLRPHHPGSAHHRQYYGGGSRRYQKNNLKALCPTYRGFGH